MKCSAHGELLRPKLLKSEVFLNSKPFWRLMCECGCWSDKYYKTYEEAEAEAKQSNIRIHEETSSI